MSIGGTTKDCFVLENSDWNYHSSMKYNRRGAVVIQMPNGIYVFGGKENPISFEFLPIGAKTWQIYYPNFMMDKPQRMIETEKTGFYFADGHKINEELLVIIKYNMIVIVNVIAKKLIQFKLQIGRHRTSSIILNNMLIISGGCCRITKKSLHLTEIVDLQLCLKALAEGGTKDFSNITRIVGSLNVARSGFGMAMINMGSRLKLIAFGGSSDQLGHLDSVEVWDETTETWKMSNMKLNHKRENFGYLTFSSKFGTSFRSAQREIGQTNPTHLITFV